MLTPADYRVVAAEGWRIAALPEFWTPALQRQVLNSVRAQTPARHPQTLPLSCALAGRQQVFFLKVFHRRSWAAACKDSLRQSRAVRFWRQGLALAADGFQVPLTVAVGEEQGRPLAKREFVVTEKLDGASLAQFLADRENRAAVGVKEKRAAIQRLGKLIRRLHDLGYVHGDLVASNIFLAPAPGGHLEFYLMDNDRTRSYPSWLRQNLWRRNLIQLNRLPLAGISLQDRMRFLHAYVGAAKFSAADRALARWLETRTRQRRLELDGIDPRQSFRMAMRWTADR